MQPSSVEAGGERKTSTSEGRENCGILVSNLVETMTVLDNSGSICITTRLVVALLQSLQSSRQSIMNSLCCILARTSDSTARACACMDLFLRPGAGATSPGVSIMVRLGQYLYSTFIIISLAEN